MADHPPKHLTVNTTPASARKKAKPRAKKTPKPRMQAPPKPRVGRKA